MRTLNERIKVLHIDSEKTWRGGQQQAAYLLERMHAMGYQTAMVCKTGSAMENYCMEKGLPCYPIRMSGELDVPAGLKIARLCRKKGYSILHLHSSHALATGLWARLFYRKVRLIAVRRVDFHIKKNLLSQYKYRTGKLEKIVCISNGIRSVLVSDGIPESKLVTIHSGVDLDKYGQAITPESMKRDLGIADDHILVGTVAAIAGHKDYPNLMRAAKIVVGKRDHVSFCAVGDGPDQKEVFDEKERLGLGRRFIFTGYRNDVGRLLKSFDLFVLASHMEGLGTSILDAQGVGLPVVACRVGGIPEAVQDGENGFLVPPKDPEALAEAIIRLVDDEGLRKSLGDRGRQTVRAFSIDHTVEKNLHLYQQIIDS